MDELFTLHPNGLFLRREAVERGYDDSDLARACRGGSVVRLRHGTYIDAAGWPDVAEEQHLRRAQGVTLRHDNRVALSHTTGALAYGLRLWDPALEQVHVTRLDGHNGRAETDVRYHRDAWSPDNLVQLDEMLMLGPVECALGAASLVSVEAGVVVLDSLLNLHLASPAQLVEAYSGMRRSPFTRHLQIAVRLARPGADSVGESRTRHMLFRHHVPEPELQYKVYDGKHLVGICDFAWPEHHLLGEFDGMIKYRRLVRPGEDPSDVVEREKRREDALREITGWSMVRYVYADLYSPARAIARTNRLLYRRTA